jgi:BlaI family transcriptional regulator, penicillinase repressor
MARRKASRLGDLQLEIMKLLWKRGPSKVADIHKELGSDRFAYTTVATMLRKMEHRDLVRHHEQGRTFYYQAHLTADEVNHNTAADLVNRVFEGSLADAVSHLLNIREVSPEELDRLEQLIRQRKRQALSG